MPLQNLDIGAPHGRTITGEPVPHGKPYDCLMALWDQHRITQVPLALEKQAPIAQETSQAYADRMCASLQHITFDDVLPGPHASVLDSAE